MRSTLLHQTDGLRTFAVILDNGDEVSAELLAFARERGVTGAALTAIGACREATLAYFDPDAEQYQDIPVATQVEVLSLVGDIATEDGEPALHAHAVLGRRDGSTVGGHLERAVVWPTLEVIVTETPEHLRKRVDAETGSRSSHSTQYPGREPDSSVTTRPVVEEQVRPRVVPDESHARAEGAGEDDRRQGP